MDDRYGPLPQRPRDLDREAFGISSRRASRPEPRSQVRIKVPDSVIDDDGSDVRDDVGRPNHHSSAHLRNVNGTSDRPALRRRKSVDLEKKTSRENEEFRRKRDQLEAQEAGAMRRYEDLPRSYGRRIEARDDDRRYGENEKVRSRRDDRDRDQLAGGGGARRHDGAWRSERGDREDDIMSDRGGRRYHGDTDQEHRREEGRRGDGLRMEDDSRREDGSRRNDESRRGDESRRLGKARSNEDRESEPRRHRRHEILNGPDLISSAVSYGSDPVDHVASRDDGERRREGLPRLEGVRDLDPLPEKPSSVGGWRPERDARDRDSAPRYLSAYDQTRSQRWAMDPGDPVRSDKPTYYDSQTADARGYLDQAGAYDSPTERSTRPADWDNRRDREWR